jgi:hypothetical protein
MGQYLGLRDVRGDKGLTKRSSMASLPEAIISSVAIAVKMDLFKSLAKQFAPFVFELH